MISQTTQAGCGWEVTSQSTQVEVLQGVAQATQTSTPAATITIGMQTVPVSVISAEIQTLESQLHSSRNLFDVLEQESQQANDVIIESDLPPALQGEGIAMEVPSCSRETAMPVLPPAELKNFSRKRKSVSMDTVHQGGEKRVRVELEEGETAGDQEEDVSSVLPPATTMSSSPVCHLTSSVSTPGCPLSSSITTPAIPPIEAFSQQSLDTVSLAPATMTAVQQCLTSVQTPLDVAYLANTTKELREQQNEECEALRRRHEEERIALTGQSLLLNMMSPEERTRTQKEILFQVDREKERRRQLNILRRQENRKLAQRGSKPSSCNKCMKTFESKKQLRIHKKNHHVDLDNAVVCPHCKGKFAAEPNLRDHIKAKHSKVLSKSKAGPSTSSCPPSSSSPANQTSNVPSQKSTSPEDEVRPKPQQDNWIGGFADESQDVEDEVMRILGLKRKRGKGKPRPPKAIRDALKEGKGGKGKGKGGKGGKGRGKGKGRKPKK